MKIIGIDNGTTGSLAVISVDAINGEQVAFYKTPIRKELNYTKTKAWINRIEFSALYDILKKEKESCNGQCKVYLERPMINPTRWKASVSAIRALETTLIAIEMLNLQFEYLDSRKWQHKLLPEGLSKEELKPASKSVCQRLYPNVNLMGKDGDAVLIAKYGMLKENNQL